MNDWFFQQGCLAAAAAWTDGEAEDRLLDGAGASELMANRRSWRLSGVRMFSRSTMIMLTLCTDARQGTFYSVPLLKW